MDIPPSRHKHFRLLLIVLGIMIFTFLYSLVHLSTLHSRVPLLVILSEIISQSISMFALFFVLRGTSRTHIRNILGFFGIMNFVLASLLIVILFWSLQTPKTSLSEAVFPTLSIVFTFFIWVHSFSTQSFLHRTHYD